MLRTSREQCVKVDHEFDAREEVTGCGMYETTFDLDDSLML